MKAKLFIKSILVFMFLLFPHLAEGQDKEQQKARIIFPPSSQIHANSASIVQLISFFNALEVALQEEGVDEVMSFYSKDYFHRGISKDQLMIFWSEVFDRYDGIYSSHSFSLVEVDKNGKRAVINCTGSIRGITKKAEEGYQIIDKWSNEAHILTLENGNWKIVGTTTKRLLNSFHPLF